MVALDTENRRKGRRAMEQSLNAAARARRAMKSGRKLKSASPVQSPFEAVQRLIHEADRARGLMRKEGLDPDDIRLTLIFRLANGLIGHKPLPAPETIGTFYGELEAVEAGSRPLTFLGIVWHQIDREADADARDISWITEFSDDNRGALELLALRDMGLRERFKAEGS
jgi:hypothetical protein